MLLAQQSKTWEETFTRVEKIINLPRVAMSAREDRQGIPAETN
jgi:hypothetical protein